MAKKQYHNSILMLMLESREIILTEVGKEDNPESYAFITPALVTATRGAHGSLGFMLTPWLPHEILKDTHIEFLKSRVVGTLTPHSALISFYCAWAGTERDKLISFEKDFSLQIKEIQEYHMKKYEATKKAYQGNSSVVISLDIPDAVYDLFEANTGWGDPSVTQ